MATAFAAPGDTGEVTETPSPPRRRLSISVRTRIVAALTVAAALGLAAVGFSVYLVERHRILDGIDERLMANLESARFLTAEDGQDAVNRDSSTAVLSTILRRMSPDDNTGAMGMVDGVITTVPGIPLDVDLRGRTAFARHLQPQLEAREPVIGTYADGGVVWRYLAVPIDIVGSPPPEQVEFVMVYDVQAELGEINTAGRAFLMASAITLLVVAATATIVSTRLLRPLRTMRETADRISAESLDERLPVVGHDDVADLSETMNDMLDRLDEALDSQRRLLSDVGHELKTPITIVRGHLEVMDPQDPEDALQTRLLAVDELDRMDRLVKDLAAAASLHGPVPVHRRAVDTADLVEQIHKKAQGIVGAEVTRGEVAHTVAVLDPARITQALLQLAQNAVTHGGGRLEIGSDADTESIGFWVRDFGPGVPDADKEAVFDRFHRGTGADAHAGSGLGLNIGRLIARAHGGTLHVEDATGGGARFVLRIPLDSFPGPAEATAPRDAAPSPTSGRRA